MIMVIDRETMKFNRSIDKFFDIFLRGGGVCNYCEIQNIPGLHKATQTPKILLESQFLFFYIIISRSNSWKRVTIQFYRDKIYFHD